MTAHDQMLMAFGTATLLVLAAQLFCLFFLVFAQFYGRGK